ncbi:hypothetical protein OHB41_50180, partial [Streptomyces sp. NBC_01571]|uniref:hypothetical protein n=1 Tax=Streptomyces sp. NBC_01571 TaxID=2975883 RepID=UPI002259B277
RRGHTNVVRSHRRAQPGGLGVLQTLFDAARTYGTEVRLAPVPVPEWWRGSVFTSDSEIAALLRAQADAGRPLGHLPLA